jgi:Acyl-protein synthetase, LuxE
MMLSDATSWLETPPYSLTAVEKRARQIPRLNELTAWHYENCAVYRNVLEAAFGGRRAAQVERMEDVPFLPVAMFKQHELRSVPQSEVVKTLTSSGTTGQAVSRIFVDRSTGMSMERALVKIMQHFLGRDRLPMVILDHKNVIKDRASFSARGAGILGLAQFGRLPFYALNDDLTLELAGLKEYLARAGTGRVFLFGFTYMVWQGFVRALEQSHERLELPDAVLVHSGGWKKLEEEAVSASEFRRRLEAVTGIRTALNFYGMVEQVGGIFMENALHLLHASIFSNVIIRDPLTLRPLPHGQKGLVQVLSVLPGSYPGHSILTEDTGIIHGEDDPAAGMPGRYFEICGRVPRAELRGCSDIAAAGAAAKPAA